MIEMIAGVFGLRVECGKDAENKPKYRVKGMGPNDGPFAASPEQEARLVKLGLARYVHDEPVADLDDTDMTGDVDDGAPIGFDETPPEDFDEAEAVEEIVDLKSLSAKELREIGKEYGLTFKANDKKSTMIEAIAAAQNELADGEDAPIFDAAEAVL